MPITEAQLAAKFLAAMNFHSDNPDVDINEARQHLANELAAGVKEFTVGRETTVIGTSATGGSVNGTGTIKATP